jgi:hypothetical protein
LLGIPDVNRVEVAPATTPQEGTSLTPFTNRLNPLVVPLRVLANAIVILGDVTVSDFTRAAPIMAREVGMQLKREDELSTRRGRQRRSTGWPIGEDQVASLARFRTSFLLRGGAHGEATGPLVDLGLVTVSDRLLLTSRGLAIAGAKTPMLGEVDGELLLSERQCELFREALLALPGEREELRVFFRGVAGGGGGQGAIDRIVQQAHPAWTEAQVVSHRAAMVGRLRDVGVIDVTTAQPGQEVSIVFEPQASDFGQALESAE